MPLLTDLPRHPYDRLRELLRRLALLSGGVALLSAISNPLGASQRVLDIAAIAGLAIAWHFGRARAEWSTAEQAVDGALILLAVSVSSSPMSALPLIYGGLSFRAFSRRRTAAGTAVAVYLLAFVGAVLVRHGHIEGSVLDDMTIVLPGVPFCAIMLHALSRALIGQEEAESRVRDSESYLRSLVDGAPMGIIALKNDDTVTLWNPGAERMFGWTSAEVIGRNLPTIPGEGADAFAARRRRERLGERLHQVELTYVRADGTPLEALLSTAPLHNAAGEIHGTIGLLADISDRKALEAQLRQSQKMEAVGQLAGGIAHDFNNLLTVIIAHAGFLRDEIAENSECAENIGEIERAANGAAALTRQLLAFSRKQVLKPVVLDLSESVVKLTGMLQRVLGEDITIVTRLSEEPTCVRADLGQVEQVVMNLVVNARDAMPFGGSLEIETSVLRDMRQPLVSVNGIIPPGSYAVLSVRDTGTGMSTEVQARIFEPFFTTKDLGRGTGLGLSTVFGIVTQSNGYLSIDSSPGNGATFSMYLPLQEDDAPRERAQAPIGSTASYGSETVLLAEDSDQLRQLTTRLLERQGYRVLAACDGAEALEIAADFAGRIDLVLTDAVMPRVGGGELVHALRAMRDDFRVLYMTGYTDDELVRRGLGEDGDELLHKPFTPAALTSVVRRVLESPRGAAA
jgi:two-component system cell cycle sensor histidine kinase/response regulator CckA